MADSSPWKPSSVTPPRYTPQSQRRSLLHSHPSPQRDQLDSPSRQILHELYRLQIDKEHSLQQDLDQQVAKQADLHLAALAFAAAEHDRVRKNAEIARERVELEIERERKRREQDEKDRLESERRAKVVREAEERRKQKELLERREQEESAKAAEERQLQEKRTQIEQQRKKEAEEVQRQKQEAEDAAKQRAKDAAANAAKAREEAQKAATPPTAAAPAPQAVSQPSSTVPTAPPVAASQPVDALQQELEQVHARYIEMHKRLKEMRQHIIAESRKIPALKTKLGDWRREIVKCMGQLTADKTKNRKPMATIQGVLQESLKFTNPSVDVSSYLISVPNPAPGTPVPMPGVLVYLLNIFAKSVVTQFISETSGGAKTADPVGVVAVSIFANPAFKISQSIPLIDLLLAKYHVVCPPLFCISGPQNTANGRNRIGWWKDGGNYIGEQRHLERMAGLSTGWSALTLRDFSKSKNENPLPNWYYWRAIASVTNTKISDVGSTHVTILKGLIDGFIGRFIGFYGNMAKAVLREALVVLPEKLKRERQDSGAVQAAGNLEVLREVLQRDSKLTLL
ncbi:Tetratricopeptide repeat protein 1 [Sphaceloma murrayae]|uniref:mRNA export factor GLE1 n=1 Tax=Sphaceloma murrayae TaxID=2082308 RepID=A0A2K1QY79_9PEZI|nr:Tetratricopeptide repeat protein 1 [Sphaceloma murrayae]